MEERGRKERQGWGPNQKKGVWVDGSMAGRSVRGVSRSLCVLGLEHDFVLRSWDCACAPIVPHRIQGKYPARMMCLGKTGQATVRLPLACTSCVLAARCGDRKERAECEVVQEP